MSALAICRLIVPLPSLNSREHPLFAQCLCCVWDSSWPRGDGKDGSEGVYANAALFLKSGTQTSHAKVLKLVPSGPQRATVLFYRGTQNIIFRVSVKMGTHNRLTEVTF